MGRLAEPLAPSSAMDAEEAAQALFSLKASPIITAQRLPMGSPYLNPNSAMAFLQMPPVPLGSSALNGSFVNGNGVNISPPKTLSFNQASPPASHHNNNNNIRQTALGAGIGLRSLGPGSTSNYIVPNHTAASSSIVTTTKAARSPRMMAVNVPVNHHGARDGANGSQLNAWAPRALVYAAERVKNEEFNRVRGGDDDNDDDDNDEDEEGMVRMDLGESADNAAGALCSLMHLTSPGKLSFDADSNGGLDANTINSSKTTNGIKTNNNNNSNKNKNNNNKSKHSNNNGNGNEKRVRGGRGRKDSVSSTTSGKPSTYGKYPALLGGPRVVKGRPRTESTLSIDIRMTNTTLGGEDDDDNNNNNNKSVSAEPSTEQKRNQTGAYSPDSRRRVIHRFLEKRRNRIWKKRIKYGVRKHFADSRLRVKGRFVRKEDEEVLRDLLIMT